MFETSGTFDFFFFGNFILEKARNF